jgi:hypothetical protein
MKTRVRGSASKPHELEAVAHIAGFLAAFGTGPSGEHLINFDNN